MAILSTGSPSNNSSSSSSLAVAARTDTLGVGFSGSGFLIFYFTGVTAILKQLGVINSKTRLAGASGGSANAALACADVPLQQQFDDLISMSTTCRPTRSCERFLDRAVNGSLTASLPPNAAQLCEGRLWVSITAAKPDNQSDPNVLLGSSWASKEQLIGAVRQSSFIPGLSGLTATLQLPELPSLGPAYDGGFSQNLPCPPGVNYCVKVSAFPFNPAANPDAGVIKAVINFNRMIASPEAAALAAGPGIGPFIPLNPVLIPSPTPDIYPGLSKPLPVNATMWSSYAMNIPDNATLRSIFDIGRQDAAFWATKQGLASAVQATKALQATAVMR